jgi:plasmid stability protein
MASDLRTLVAEDLRVHPRVAYQGVSADDETRAALLERLPPMPSFRRDYCGAIAVIDWDHRLPSQLFALRIYGYYTDDAYEAGQEAYDDRVEEIGRRDMYPEFDVPDFDNLAADEAYEIELSIDCTIGRCRLTSAWRRSIAAGDANAAVEIAQKSGEFIKLAASSGERPTHLGELEAVSWTPPCESQHEEWTLDVWYLLAFDGRVGTGRSFLVDLSSRSMIVARDFSVRTG